MKVLFVHSGKTDYLQDALFSGLVEVLGSGNVLCSSWYKRFHLDLWSHPKNLGLTNFRMPTWISEDTLREVDIALIASCKAQTFRSFLKLEPLLPTRTKIVFIDGSDDPRIAGDLEREGSPSLFSSLVGRRELHRIFKREMLLDSHYDRMVLPISFASGLEWHAPKTTANRYMDVAFWAVESNPVRSQILRAISGEFDCARNGTSLGNTFRGYRRRGLGYLDALQSVKILLNFRGAGWDTLRYWEVTMLGGFLISQKPNIHITNNFEDGKSIVFVGTDPEEVIDKCKFYLSKPLFREQVEKNARLHSLLFHKRKDRAEYVLRNI